MAAVSSSPPPQRQLRVVIFPWLAFGHLLPYLELAERLASRGHRVSFVSTPGNLARLPPPRASAAAAPRVDLVALPLPRVEGVPDGAESTNSVPHDKFELLFQAFDGLAAPFAEFLSAACADEGTRPDWIVVDSFHHWAATAAVEHKVPCAMLLPSAAYIISARDGQFPRYESEKNAAEYYTKHAGASGMSLLERFSWTHERCTLTAMRSCVEWEPESFPQMAPLLGKPVVPLGLLPSSPEGVPRRRRALLAGRTAAELRRVRGAGERGAAARGAGARAGTRAGARRDTVPLGTQEARRRWCSRRRRRHPATSRFPGAHTRPWARGHGLGAPGRRAGARRRGRVPDALRAELALWKGFCLGVLSSCCRSWGTKGRMRASWRGRRWGCRCPETRTTDRSTAMASRAQSVPSWWRKKQGVCM